MGNMPTLHATFNDIACRYRDGDNCMIAATLAYVATAKVTPPACQECRRQPHPQDLNYVTVCLASHALRHEPERRIAFLAEHKSLLEQGQPRHGLANKVPRYIEAVKRWYAAGSPVRSDDEVSAVLRLCQACEMFSGNGCELCGCKINQRRLALLNKARMATESCPVGKW